MTIPTSNNEQVRIYTEVYHIYVPQLPKSVTALIAEYYAPTNEQVQKSLNKMKMNPNIKEFPRPTTL